MDVWHLVRHLVRGTWSVHLHSCIVVRPGCVLLCLVCESHTSHGEFSWAGRRRSSWGTLSRVFVE
jgi:hypothetical protein